MKITIFGLEIQLPTMGQIIRGLIADEAKIQAAELGVWDAVVKKAAEKHKIPNTRLGWLAARLALSVTGTTVQINTNSETLFGKLGNELGGDMTSELIVRARQMARELAKDPEFQAIVTQVMTLKRKELVVQ